METVVEITVERLTKKEKKRVFSVIALTTLQYLLLPKENVLRGLVLLVGKQ